MQRGDDLRALAHRCRHPLDRSGTDAADGKDPLHIRLEPARAFLSRHYEAFRIEGNAGAGEPLGIGLPTIRAPVGKGQADQYRELLETP